ncbi:hypothetical protein [Aneurinibacillus terranovensis]|uniref:hypothetical protein n=1 Tax=Aneurinibacillus terranovensis TaxID=278991 RepID=UPI0004846FE2|nr:hypothetical protein [Aneurinibacillus terranovensis]
MTQFSNLNQFDMVYALTQETVNKQFELLSVFGVLPTTWHVSIKKGLYGVDSELGTPTVGFNTGDSSSRRVNMYIPITKGTLTYSTILGIDDNGKVLVKTDTHDITNAKLTFKVNVSIAEIAATYKDSKLIPKTVKEQLTNFDDSMFSIQHLFLNFEDANLLDSFELDTSGVSAGVPGTDDPEFINNVKALFKAFIEPLKGSDNPYVLGYSAVDRKVESSDATWKPTGVTYSVYSDAAHLNRSSINYLLVTDGKNVPGSGAGLFNHNWVFADNVQGTFVFSQELVMKNILDAIAKQMNIHYDKFERDGTLIRYQVTIPNDIGGNTTCSVVPKVTTNQIIANFVATYKKDVHDKAGSYIGYIDGDIRWTTAFRYDVDSAKGTISVNVSSTDQARTENEHKNALGEFEDVLADFADAFISVFTFGQVNDVFNNMVKEDWSLSISTSLSADIQGLKTRIILPGGSEIMFKDVRFYEEGSMLLSTTVRN